MESTVLCRIALLTVGAGGNREEQLNSLKGDLLATLEDIERQLLNSQGVSYFLTAMCCTKLIIVQLSVKYHWPLSTYCNATQRVLITT